MPHAVHGSCSRDQEHYSKWKKIKKSLDTQFQMFLFFFCCHTLKYLLTSVTVSCRSYCLSEWGECRMFNENVNYWNAEQTLSRVASGVCSVCTFFLFLNKVSASRIPYNTYSATVQQSLAHSQNESKLVPWSFALLYFCSFFGLSIVLCGYLSTAASAAAAIATF